MTAPTGTTTRLPGARADERPDDLPRLLHKAAELLTTHAANSSEARATVVKLRMFEDALRAAISRHGVRP